VGRHGQAATAVDDQARYESRWLLRHMEIGREEGGAEPSLVLYSTPPVMPLPAFAPSREPSAIPHSVRGLFPRVWGDEAAIKLIGGGAMVLSLQLFVFLRKRHQEAALRAAETVQRQLLLPTAPHFAPLRDAAIKATATGRQLAPAHDGELYGVATADAVSALTSVVNPNVSKPSLTETDLLFGAARDAQGAWALTHASLLEDVRLKTVKLAPLAHLPPAEAQAEARAAIDELIAAATTVRLDTVQTPMGQAKEAHRPPGKDRGRGGRRRS
jgi:hypothetical protein